MNEVIGRVADAALNDLCDRKGIKQELNAVRYGDPETWEEIREAVGRAAILAMREPTEDMIEAGNNAPDDYTSKSISVIWKTMIDDALTDQ